MSRNPSSSNTKTNNEDNNKELPDANKLASLPRPNDSCYYVTDNILAGEYPTTTQTMDKYLDLGITHFVDLTDQGEKQAYDQLLQQEVSQRGIESQDDCVCSYRRMAVQDFGIPSYERMKAILDEIDRATTYADSNSSSSNDNNNNKNKVYVHCRGGIGRTGTVVGCYLVRRFGLTGDDALAIVNRLFQNSARSAWGYPSPETDEQRSFVRNWKEEDCERVEQKHGRFS